jgi:hypothetical protein
MSIDLVTVVNRPRLAALILARARLLPRDRDEPTRDETDNAELLRVLSRIVARLPDTDENLAVLHSAFGAPGDWGYGEPMGDALAALYRRES